MLDIVGGPLRHYTRGSSVGRVVQRSVVIHDVELDTESCRHPRFLVIYVGPLRETCDIRLLVIQRLISEEF